VGKKQIGKERQNAMHVKDLGTNNLQQAHELAYRKACDDFRRWNPLDMAVSSGTEYNREAEAFFVRYLTEEYKVTFPFGEVGYAQKNDPVPITVKVILLHYLLRAGGQPLKKQWISFKDIPEGGMLYLEPFNNRVINYLLAVFGKKPGLMIEAGKVLGGENTSFGDHSVQLLILPHLPITYVLWENDDEFPARATVLFDATAPFYLPTEDLVVATAYGVGQLAKTAKKLEASNLIKK
jgi:hypothetical protein